MTVIDLRAARMERHQPLRAVRDDRREERWPLWQAALLWVSASTASWAALGAAVMGVMNVLAD